MPQPENRSNNVIDLHDARVRLRDNDMELHADHVDAQGLSLRDSAQVHLGRFVWMDLELPEGEPVRALGEVLPRRNPTSLALEIRFKHLFPDQKRRLLRALGA